MRTKQTLVKIVAVEHLGRHLLAISFSDGTIQAVDFGPFLNNSRHPEIRKFIAQREFKKFIVKDGELMWGDFDLVFPLRDLYENKILRHKTSSGQKAG